MSGRRPPNTANPEMSRYPFVWSALGLLACLAGVAAALAGAFSVRQVQVIGANLPRATIVQAADIEGHNVFSVRSDAVVDSLATVPEIVVQRVETSFPDRVTIFARERLPIVAWQPIGGGTFLLDDEGHVIEQVRNPSLPIIVGGSIRTPLGAGIVAAVRFAVHRLPLAPSGAIASFRFDSSSGLTIRGRSGWTAAAGRGTPRQLTDRIANLAAFLKSIHNRPFKFVDLRNHPYAVFTGP